MHVFPEPSLMPGARKARLEDIVRQISGGGARNLYHLDALRRAAAEIEQSFAVMGYRPMRQTYEAKGIDFANIIGELPGHSPTPSIVMAGAHYDSHKDSPGANDNGSAVAALLELARAAARRRHAHTLRFVAFTNEETPFTRTKEMGSYVYAAGCRARRDPIAAMLCLENIGCYSDQIGSQRLSIGGLILPRRGNFLALIGNPRSRTLLKRIASATAREGGLRVEPWTLPSFVPGARSSDQWSFWQHGFPAVMATDTAPLRYRHYHTREDTPDKIDFVWLDRVVSALDVALCDLASVELQNSSRAKSEWNV
jgi:Zn-dependent M28 family amino/carboxypeptidase